MGRQSGSAEGVELFAITALATLIHLYGFWQAFRHDSPPSNYRLAVGTALYVAEMLRALVLTFGCASGLYIVAVAMTLNVAFMIYGAWLLVVAVYGQELGA